MNQDPRIRGLFAQSAELLRDVMPKDKMTLAEAVSFWGNVAVFIVFALGMGINTMTFFGLEPGDFGGLLSIVLIFGSIVAGVAASGVAISWLKSRRVPGLAGCLIVPIVALVAYVIGWWLLLILLALAAADTFGRRTEESPPITDE